MYVCMYVCMYICMYVRLPFCDYMWCVFTYVRYMCTDKEEQSKEM